MPTKYTIKMENDTVAKEIEIPDGYYVLPPTEIIEKGDIVYVSEQYKFQNTSYWYHVIGLKAETTLCTIRKIKTETPPPLPTSIKNNDAKICANCHFYNQGSENTTLKDWEFQNCYFHAEQARNIITGKITMDHVYPCSNMRQEGNCGLEAKFYKEKAKPSETEYDQAPSRNDPC